MWKCPNCNRVTARTKDWACQWCGYPLLRESSGRLPKTYEQLKREKLHEPKLPVREGALAPITPTVIVVTVEEVYSACESDKAAADARFRDKVLKVTGVVDRIVVDTEYNIHYINLNSAEKRDKWNVRCMFDRKDGPELNQLTDGQVVTVKGNYDGCELNVLIKDCALVY